MPGTVRGMLRDRRRNGAGPYVLGLRRVEGRWGTGFPFDLAVIRGIEGLRVDAPVALLAGDNGAGKSTVVEAVAEAMGFPPEGGELERFSDGPGSTVARPRPVLGGALEPVTGATKPSRGYFLRAESFFNVAGSVGDPDVLLAPDLSIYGGTDLLHQSHGESFLALAANRFGGGGLYVLDEPEAALSVTGQLALLSIVARAATDGAQFLIATHSPILLALPGARIYELDDEGARAAEYDELEAVRLTRGFLSDPARWVRAALE